MEQNVQAIINDIILYIFMIGILISFFIICIKMSVNKSKVKRQQKTRIKSLKDNGMTIYSHFTHINGLPIAENMICEVFSYPNKLEFKSGNMNFSLSKNKIIDMCLKSETEIQKQYVSSVGGAIGGAILFGPVGAIIGGRSKQKKTKTNHTYLIITYKNNDEIKYIGFDAASNFFKAGKLVDEFKNNNHNAVNVEL